MTDANYRLGRMVATLKQVVRETYNQTAIDELRSWAGDQLCTEAEGDEIDAFLEDAEAARTAGGKR